MPAEQSHCTHQDRVSHERNDGRREREVRRVCLGSRKRLTGCKILSGRERGGGGEGRRSGREEWSSEREWETRGRVREFRVEGERGSRMRERETER